MSLQIITLVGACLSAYSFLQLTNLSMELKESASFNARLATLQTIALAVALKIARLLQITSHIGKAALVWFYAQKRKLPNGMRIMKLELVLKIVQLLIMEHTETPY